MQITINMLINEVEAAAATVPQSPRETAATALRDVADQIETDIWRCSFIGQLVDEFTERWVGGFHVVILPDAASEGEAQPVAFEMPSTIDMTYRNYRGEVDRRRVIPSRIWFGATEWHPEPGWLMTAYDPAKRANRDFALADCQFADLAHPSPASEAVPLDAYSTPTRQAAPEAGDLISNVLVDAVRKHLAWMDAFLCVEDEVRSSTPRKVFQNSQDAAEELRAALHALPAPTSAGTVKPLVWVRDPDNAGDDWFSRAWADVYCYEVGQDDGPEATWWWQEDAVTSMAAVRGFASEDAAKEAAQADFAARILAQIEGQV